MRHQGAIAMRWLRRLRYWMRFRGEQDALRQELDLHEEMLIEDFEQRGLSPADAASAARRAMGNQGYMREESRGVWLAPRLDALIGDCRYAWRGLRRSPGFTFVAVLSLALGIGANTAIFGVIYSVLLARLDVPAAAELVQVRRTLPSGATNEGFTRAEVDALASGPLPVASFTTTFATLDAGSGDTGVSIDAVDGRFFSLIGLHAARGRLIGPSDDGAPVVVITDAFWRSQLNADSAVLGRTIAIDRHPFTVVGIMPARYAGLRFPGRMDVSIPYRTAVALGIIRERSARSVTLAVVARRARGQSLSVVSRDLNLLWRRCCALGEAVDVPRGQSLSPSTVSVVDVSRGITIAKLDLRGEYARILFALMAGVGILLLAACANVANLLLARGRARAGELAVRLAIGASRRRVATQLVVESALLGVLGGVAGLLLAWWASAILSREDVGDLSGLISARPSVAVLSFTLVVSLGAVVLFGLAPAARVLRTDLLAPLQQGAARVSSGNRGFVDAALVSLQVALALLLVTGASLLVQTLRNLQQAPLGFDPAGRVAVQVETRHTAYEPRGMTVPMATEMLRRVAALPGIASAAFGSLAPVVGGRGSSDNVSVRGGPVISDDDAQTSFIAVTPGYFATLGVSFIEGRDLTLPSGSRAARSRDVVVNQEFAKKFFPRRDPIGQVFQDSDDGDSTATDDRIVGVVRDIKVFGARQEAEPQYFVPVADSDWPYLELVIRLRGEGTLAPATLARAIGEVAPGITVGDSQNIASAVASGLTRERIAARLATVFGVLALCLVGVGLYGVLLYRVAERGREIGIRMALGASGRSVIGLVLTQSLRVVGAGVVIGIPLALMAGKAVGSQLYGVAPYSAAVLSVAIAVVIGAAGVASVIPARRAVRVDPLTALRSG